jgi:hypothetical protein
MPRVKLLVFALLRLDLVQDQVAILEGPGLNPSGVVSLKRLLVRH